MIGQLSVEEATNRWEFLLGIKNLKSRKAIASRPKSSSFCIRGRAISTILPRFSFERNISLPVPGPVDNPFDCSTVAVLPTHDIVENAVHQYLEEWKKLDDRKLLQKATASKSLSVYQDDTEVHENENNSVTVETKASINTNHGGGWRAMEDRLSLPDGFDYNAKISDQQLVEGDIPVDDGYSGDHVISLRNPTQRLSYDWELSKLFYSIPTCRELEEQARLRHEVDSTLRVYQETHNPTRTTPDCYALARLRMPDRHGLPQSLRSYSHCNMRSTKRRGNQSSCSNSATVVLEFWRKQPKRDMSLGCHRMVLEFLASQTLWDVHVILSHMAEDDLWVGALGEKAPECDSNISIENASMTGCCDEKDDKKLQQKRNIEKACEQNLSGCFFIENTFYKTGSVDYAKPVIDWIDGIKSNRLNHIRRGYLGIDASDIIKDDKTMKMTKLSQVPFRRNIRYHHACHGDVETTVMLVDRKFICHTRDQNKSKRVVYPLIHDVWIAPRLPAVPLCDACQIYQSVFKTSTNCKTTDGGPRSLCHECCKDSNLLNFEQNSVKLHKQWHNQANLSNGIAREQSTAL